MPKPESVFKPPEDENAKIWRYMDFSKFVSLLSLRSLYFSRSDLLGDPFEASYPKANKEIRENYVDELITKISDSNVKLPTDWKETFLTGMSYTNKFLARCMFVNCWHVNDSESFGMWKIYVKDSKGIVIRSTYQLLRELLPRDIFIGKVTYIDYMCQPLMDGDFLSPVVHKRKSFEFENELRAVKFSLDKSDVDIETHQTREPIRKGISIPIDINGLISAIYVAPSSEEWFYNLVSDVSKKYELDVPIQKSPLDEIPFF